MHPFEAFYKKYFRAVFAFLRRLGLTREDARELAQDVFVRVYEHWDDYRHEAEWSFLKVIARRLALNWIRDRHAAKRAMSSVPLEALEREPESAAESQEGVLSKVEQKTILRRRLKAAIGELPPPLRQCVLRRLGDMSYKEIADELGISMHAVKSRLHEAKDLLMKLLPKESGDISWLGDPAAEDDHDREE